jgi:TrwC relaxase
LLVAAEKSLICWPDVSSGDVLRTESSVGRIASLLQTPFLAFDDNYGFLALSASVWTMGKIRDGAQWLSNHYAANDYYCEGEKVVGTWVGKGAEILRIEGRSIEPQDEAFLAIFSGKTPSGEKLKQRDSDIIGYDFQYNCRDAHGCARLSSPRHGFLPDS